MSSFRENVLSSFLFKYNYYSSLYLRTESDPQTVQKQMMIIKISCFIYVGRFLLEDVSVHDA
jgi:hypothetical protein